MFEHLRECLCDIHEAAELCFRVTCRIGLTGIRHEEQMTIIVGIAVHDNEGMRSTKENIVYSVITPLHLIKRDALGSGRVIQCPSSAIAPGVDPGDSAVRKRKREQVSCRFRL